MRRAILALACALAIVVARAAPVHATRTPRIVSLIPSLTEDLFAIGAGPQVVAVSTFTDFPPEATRLPVVATYSTISSERIVDLHPDVVVGIPAQAPIVGDLVRAGLHPRLLADDSFEDIFTNLATLGALSGHPDRARALADRLRARTKHIVAAVARATHGAPPPRVFVVLSTAPIFTVGPSSYIATLIRFAGGVDAASDLTTAYARYGDESLLALQPDAIVTDRSVGLAAVLDRPPWNALRAVREKRVYVLDNPDLIQRPGPRYNEGLAWLATHLHPNVSLR